MAVPHTPPCPRVVRGLQRSPVVFYNDFLENKSSAERPDLVKANMQRGWCTQRRATEKAHKAHEELARFRRYADLTARFAAFVIKAAESQVRVHDGLSA